MVTDAMIEAGCEAYTDWQQGRDKCSLGEAIYIAMHAARPTADLGEDGELVAKLRRSETGPNGEPINIDGPEAADRLELYREALEQIAAVDAPLGPDTQKLVTHIARAVLSRSGK